MTQALSSPRLASLPTVQAYRDAMMEVGIPLAQFTVADVQTEYERRAAADVTFTQLPTDIGTAVIAVFDDTCGDLIQIIAMKELRQTES